MKRAAVIFSGAIVLGVAIAILSLAGIGIIFKTGNSWIPEFMVSHEFLHLCAPFIFIIGGAIMVIDVLAEKYADYQIKKHRERSARTSPR